MRTKTGGTSGNVTLRRAPTIVWYIICANKKIGGKAKGHEEHPEMQPLCQEENECVENPLAHQMTPNVAVREIPTKTNVAPSTAT